ncbi:MAG: Rne/Rng family ribonuclease [Capsulimonadaceae bacterium]|nr:Rne/Rng family ribonuclease [Capsulimonadaceae bacterium]
MSKEILVNAASRETRIAVLDDRQLVELRVEREEPVVGNVYKGRVENVLPGMDAAFVDIGLERNAFLYVADILPEALEQGDEEDEDVEDDLQSAEPDSHDEVDEDEVAAAIEERIRSGEDDGGDLVAEANALLAEAHAAGYDRSLDEEDLDIALDSVENAHVSGYQDDEATALDSADEVEEASSEDQDVENDLQTGTAQPKTPARPDRQARQDRRPQRRPMRGRGYRRQIPIQELVQTRQELVVQVVKGPRGTKGSRVSTRMSFPGRYLVLMPDANNVGVSRKIEDARERDRLKRIVDKFRQQGFGIIVRTEAEGKRASELYQDYLMLVETWVQIQHNAKTTPAPGIIHQDMSLIYTIIRDAFGSDVDKLILDSPEDFARAHEIVSKISPELTDRIHLYDGLKPMFEHYRIEEDIERLLRRKVWLRSGGYLVVDQTEALTSIDINTGKFTGSTGLTETILQTNMEATGEIARQLRLRDIGGMIILDFIDMDNPRDKKLVTDTLVKALKNDRSRTKISSISPLGLIEMTRKRTKETVDVALTDICPYCHGLGRVSSAETVSMTVERYVTKLSTTVNSEAILILAHPDVAAQLIGAEGEDIERLEHTLRRAIYVRAQPNWHVEKFEVEPGTMAKIEQAYPLPRRGTVIECAAIKNVLSPPPWATAHLQGGYQLDIMNAAKFVGQNIRVRLRTVGRSLAIGESLQTGGKPGDQRGGKGQDKGRGPRTPAGTAA